MAKLSIISYLRLGYSKEDLLLLGYTKDSIRKALNKYRKELNWSVVRLKVTKVLAKKRIVTKQSKMNNE